MSLQMIRAGGAIWEVSVKDKTKAGLDAASARIKAVADMIRGQQSLERDLKLINGPTAQERMLSFAHVLKSVAQPLNKLAMDLGIIGGAILAPLAAAANTFMTLGKAMGNASAIELTNTWKELRNVFKTIAFVTGEAVAPALQTIGKVLVTVGFALARFLQQNPLLAQILLGVGIGATVAAAGLGLLAVTLTAAGAALSLLASPLAPMALLIGGVTAAAIVLAGAATLVATNWEGTKNVMLAALDEMVLHANAASRSILESFKKMFEGLGLKGLAAMASVAAGVLKQAEPGLAGGVLGNRTGGAAQLRAIRSAAEGFGVSVTKSASGVGRVGPTSIQKVNDTLTHERLKEILDELKKPGGGAAKFD